MKIGFVNSYYPPWVGGAESYVKSLAIALSSRGHDVSVFCSDRPLKSGETIEDGIRIIRMKTPLTLYGTPLVIFPRSAFETRFDIIHANFPSPYLSGVSAFVSKLRDTACVLTWHNDLPPVSSAAEVFVKIHDWISPIYLRKYDRIIATTAAYATKSPLLSRYEEKVRVVMNGVDTNRFNPNVSGTKLRLELGLGNSPVVLFVGALTTYHSYKGVDVLLRAFQLVSHKLNDARLLIVGGGNLLEDYRALADELMVGDRVIFSGRVSDERLPECYAAADLSVLPSKDSSEGFGLVLLEAMATGKAVIGSRVGGIVNVIQDGVNGITVPPNDPVRLSEAMIELLTNSSIRKNMGLAGRKRAELLDWSEVAVKVENIYSEIL